VDRDAQVRRVIRRVGAEPMVYGGNTVDVCRFEQEKNVQSEDGSSLIGSQLAVMACNADVPGLQRWSDVTFQGQSWKVIDFERSGDGREILIFLGNG